MPSKSPSESWKTRRSPMPATEVTCPLTVLLSAMQPSSTILDGVEQSALLDVSILTRFSGPPRLLTSLLEIQHPIHLARLILDYSAKPLSLRRVPPNLLAGPGATDFAESLHMPVLPPDGLVSHSARDRWLKWARDLKAAESRVSQSNEGSETGEVAESDEEAETLQYSAHPGQQSQLPSSVQYSAGISQEATPGRTSPLSMWTDVVEKRTSDILQIMIPQPRHQSSVLVWTLP